MRHADQAMYHAKESGKNCFHLFDAEHDRLVKANRDTMQRLEEALNRNEFELFYQPKVNMANGQVIGAEALIRWRHPERGILPPADFLPLLGGTELEIRVGEWVIEKALAQLDVWAAPFPQLIISVNISARHLLRQDFIPNLSAALQRHPTVAAGQLELEILESTAINDLSNASRTLNSCIALGVHFALDDFGTGYSSLTYFRKLPVGTLKIDQSFVRGMIDDPEDLGIIESVIALAQAFNRPVIAEGVETLDHGAMLVIMGCPLAQGYGIARPMPASHLPEWIAQWHGHDLWQTLSNYALPAEDLALLSAQRSHQKWLEEIKEHIADPQSSTVPALQHTQCPFGRWFYGSGMSRYGQFAEYAEIEVLHTHIHELATNIHALLENDKQSDAESFLPELSTLHNQLLAKFGQLVNRVIQQSANRSAVPPAPTFQ
jgi:EAL domain-containing protein (putative c-di-GMP-specific phosphodiesterase class I)